MRAVMVTLENGPIKPGDPLTMSPTVRGRATKAVGPARVIGYATTSFPYVDGEKRMDDYLGVSVVTADHVICYLNVGWYAPTSQLGDGIEPPKQESAFDMVHRLTKEQAATSTDGLAPIKPVKTPEKK